MRVDGQKSYAVEELRRRAMARRGQVTRVSLLVSLPFSRPRHVSHYVYLLLALWLGHQCSRVPVTATAPPRDMFRRHPSIQCTSSLKPWEVLGNHHRCMGNPTVTSPGVIGGHGEQNCSLAA